jgi:hypothetical protein
MGVSDLLDYIAFDPIKYSIARAGTKNCVRECGERMTGQKENFA